jgi:hypothetical protein
MRTSTRPLYPGVLPWAMASLMSGPYRCQSNPACAETLVSEGTTSSLIAS